jgi:hypothetical protein
MIRIILGVIAGYIAYSILLFVLFSGLYTVLGAAGSFQAGNYDLTMSWILPSIVVFFVGGAVASFVCALIAKNAKSGLYMGGVILALGLLIAFMQIAQDPGVTARGAEEVGVFDAMNKAHGPIWTFFANAVAGFVGAVTGGNLFSKGE